MTIFLKSSIPLRLKLREILDPFQHSDESTRTSLYTDLFIIACILISCSLIPAEHIWPEYQELFWLLDLIFTAIFVIEYLLRWYASPNRFNYPLTKFAIIDLVAILPTLLLVVGELLFFDMARSVRLLRLLRLLRMLRLLRLLKFIRYGLLLYKMVIDLKIWMSKVRDQNRATQLERIFMFALISWIIGANTLYLTEVRLAPESGNYTSYWLSYWHIIIVLFSGIEDKEPVSILGKIEIAILLLTGICFAGIITGEIVSILVKKIQRSGKVALKPPASELERHIIIIGQNKHLNNVIKQVNAALKGNHYMLIVCRDAENLKAYDPVLYKKVMAVSGDALKPRILDTIQLDKALRVILLSSSFRHGDSRQEVDNRTLMKTLAIVGRNANIPIVAELQHEDNLQGASILEKVEFVVSRLFGEKLISQAVLSPGITEIYDSLMTFSGDTSEFYTVSVPDNLIGKTFKEAQLFFLDMDDEAIVLVGIDRSPSNLPNTKFWLSPKCPKNGLEKKAMILEPDDKLIIIAFERPEFAELTQDDLWEGKVLTRK